MKCNWSGTLLETLNVFITLLQILIIVVEKRSSQGWYSAWMHIFQRFFVECDLLAGWTTFAICFCHNYCCCYTIPDKLVMMNAMSDEVHSAIFLFSSKDLSKTQIPKRSRGKYFIMLLSSSVKSTPDVENKTTTRAYIISLSSAIALHQSKHHTDNPKKKSNTTAIILLLTPMLAAKEIP